jgi:hypothetical protein
VNGYRFRKGEELNQFDTIEEGKPGKSLWVAGKVKSGVWEANAEFSSLSKANLQLRKTDEPARKGVLKAF